MPFVAGTVANHNNPKVIPKAIAEIFDGGKNLIGKLVPVKIINSNQNSLFGEIDLNNKFIAA